MKPSNERESGQNAPDRANSEVGQRTVGAAERPIGGDRADDQRLRQREKHHKLGL